MDMRLRIGRLHGAWGVAVEADLTASAAQLMAWRGR